MHVLLISTYELGHQPLHIAAPAAELVAAGHQVSSLDLSLDAWDPSVVDGVEAVAISVPMHTALRLAIETGRRIRQDRPELPIAFYGLYAGVGQDHTFGEVADRLIAGEYEDHLLAWLDSLGGSQSRADSGTRVTVEVGRRKFLTPDRRTLPGIDRYAHLATPDGHKKVGYVEASHGCRHRCTHCPIPVVYDGRYRITGADTVLADIAQLAEAGAGHVTFGDPDFLNAPAYAVDVVEKAHAQHPDLTFDVTVKVEHILAHRDLWPRLAAAGVIFTVSAIESLDPGILARMDKNHTPADAEEAVSIVRDVGVELHPTWLPFTPWSTADGVADIASFVWRHGLASVTDPVQLSIRLLIPDGSLMLEVDDLAPYLTGFDPAALGYTWRAADPAMDELQVRLSALAETGSTEDPVATLREMTRVIAGAAGVEIPTTADVTALPRLSEPWFCCAEPTGSQLAALETPRV